MKKSSPVTSSEKAACVLRSQLAGSWFDSHPERLRAELEGYLAKVDDPVLNDVIALISPHAGYRYSGPAAAHGFKQIHGKSYSRVVLLGPTHRLSLRDAISVQSATAFSTPLGDLPYDEDFIARLRKFPFVKDVAGSLEGENSLEMQFPFLQAVVGQPKIVPIVVGQLDEASATRIGQSLLSLLDTQTLVIVSSDFTHYGPRFQYVPFRTNVEENIRKLDLGAVAQIEAKNLSGFLDYIETTGATICGRDTIALLLAMLPPDAKPQLLCYDNSGRLTGDFDNPVSYVSMAVTGHWPAPSGEENTASNDLLSKEDKANLLALARKTILYHFKKGSKPSPKDIGVEISPAMKTVMGVFVTLHEKGDLRGCIGEIFPRRPLYEAVIDQALNSAFADTRFMPVEEKEMKAIRIEISALTPPQPVASYRDIEIGRHGMVLTKRGRSAVFLPQVAPEQNWNLDQTLTHLSMKAGLPPDAWKEGASFTVFEAIVFSEDPM